MHVDEEQVERLRHGELAASAERAVREHLASCSACHALAVAADGDERDVLDSLRSLDHQPPPMSAEWIAARARRREPRRSRWLAAILTLAIGGIAYAAPGSPVRSWLTAVTRADEPRAEPLTSRAAPLADSAVAGVAVDPGATLVITFGVARAGDAGLGRAIVTLVDSSTVSVRAPRAAATFSTDVDALAVENWDPSATFEILVPRSAPRVHIRVGGLGVFLKTGTTVTTTGQSTESGSYVIPLTFWSRSLPR